MELDKKKVIIILVASAIIFIGLIIFMIFAFRSQTKNVNQETKETVSQTTQQKATLRIDGIENLYFIPQDQRSGFTATFAEYLKSENISHNGVVMQVGEVGGSQDNTIFTYNIYVPVNEIYVSGKYYLNTKTSVYTVEKDEEKLEDLNLAPCNPGNIDYQEAPSVEDANMPVVISNENALSSVLQADKMKRLKTELEAFLAKDYEFRREVIVSDNILEDGDKTTFVLEFTMERLDKKVVQIVHKDNGFVFKLITK